MERVTRAEQQARTRARLLAEGARIFAERGFVAATVEEITAAAGVTRGALYKHFDGKEGVFLALAETIADEQLSSWEDGEDVALTDEEHLSALTAPLEQADVHLARASVEFLAHVRGRPDLHERVLELQRAVDARAAAALRRMCRALGLEPGVPIEDLVPQVTGMANGLALRASFDPDVDAAALFRAGLVALLAGATHPLTTHEELTHDRH